MTAYTSHRASWPFAGLLPHRLHQYPLPVVMPEIRPPTPNTWPPVASNGYREWESQTSELSNDRNMIYLHVPLCPFKCDFCPFFIEAGDTKTDMFIEHVLKEMELYARVPGIDQREFGVVYFGGGTPTQLSPKQLAKLLGTMKSLFHIADDAEITLEGVAKQMLAPGYLEECLSAGFNRISFGVQSLDQDVRKSIGRRGDDVEDYPAAVELARKLDPDLRVNVEIMFGCPGQSDDSLQSDLKEILSWNPHTIDAYNFTVMPGTTFHRKLSKGRNNEPAYGARLLAMRQLVASITEAAGYKNNRAEMYVRADSGKPAACYPIHGTNALRTVIPLGPSGIGHIDGTTYRNIPDIDPWAAAVSSGRLPVDRAQTMSAKIARCRGLVFAIGNLFVPYALVVEPRHRRLFEKWTGQGLVTREAHGYKLSERGALWENQMEVEILPLTEQLRMLPAIASVAEQEKAATGESGLGQELMAIAASQNQLTAPVRTAAYKAGLKVLRRLPLLEQRPLGYHDAVGKAEPESPRWKTVRRVGRALRAAPPLSNN